MVVVVRRWLLLVWDLVVTTGGSMLMLSLWCGSVSSSHFCFWLIAVCRNGGQRSEAAAASLAARRGSRAAGLEFCVEVVRFCASPQRSCRCC
ncbi:unnamed protein product [Microthlaspi erraticum]|uniref:Uncharacterized protein n=1 Tax=Microthlaspi erraticum TaxID=1685480 RepID=A0A6D2L5K7_9BRAS|nr:unnamed protein product [Microthlaspi erraticum]CAA7059604.1 unnamed protein product [Microthlaspi erraticum]CAA7059607.1 unnamed protein product [Microthlaspi erraticum]